MADTPKRYCKKCLLRELGEQTVLADIEEAIARTPDADKASEAVCAQRISLCRECDELLNGMCRLCGCYVEFRTAMKNQRCPHTPPKWDRIK